MLFKKMCHMFANELSVSKEKIEGKIIAKYMLKAKKKFGKINI
jgi:hypothetical protein